MGKKRSSRKRRSKNYNIRTKRLNNIKTKGKNKKRITNKKRQTRKRLKTNRIRMKGGSLITEEKLKNKLGSEWVRGLGSIQTQLISGLKDKTDRDTYMDEGKITYLMEWIKENKKKFFDKLYVAINSNNDFTDQDEGAIRNAYFNNEKKYKELSDFKNSSGMEVDYEDMETLNKETAKRGMDKKKQKGAGKKILYIPDENKEKFAKLFLDSEGIRLQFISRATEVLNTSFKEKDDLLKSALEMYFEEEGDDELLSILLKVIDNSNLSNYKQAVERIEENEDEGGDTGPGDMFAMDDY